MLSSVRIATWGCSVNNTERFKELIRLMWKEARESGNLMGWSGASDRAIEELTKEDKIKEIISSNVVFVVEINNALVGFTAGMMSGRITLE